MTVAGENSRGERTTVPVNSKLENRLLGYITAAGAASVGLMAMAHPAEAKVVYTPLANIPLTSLTTIDFDGDGVADVSFKFLESGYGAEQIIYPLAGNSLALGSVNHQSGALPLPWLTRIGPNIAFSQRDGIITGVDGCHSTCGKFGLWLHQVDKYVGVKFLVSGQTHYGWIRLTVQGALSGYASGYAYETIADKPIIAGKTSGPNVAVNAAPSELAPSAFRGKQTQSLGILARGVDGVAIWRREEEAVRG
ncbi:MAG TPA: hypothetical protein VIH89_02525 [Candidatus Sulfotelmatobacter sp.]